MKTKIISALLSVCFIIGIAQPAAASYAGNNNSLIEEHEIVLASGDRVAFVPTAQTNTCYEYSYYLNGRFAAKYIISADDYSVTKIDARNGEITEVKAGVTAPEDTLDEGISPLYMQQAGKILFNYSSALRCAPESTVTYETTSSTTQKQLVGEKGKEVADLIGETISVLMTVGFAYIGASSAAESLMQSAFGEYVDIIVNGIFVQARTETYTIHTTIYKTVVSTIGQTSHTARYSGAERWVSCKSFFTDESDYDSQGITIRNWNRDDNVRMYWSDAYGNVQNPGYRVA